MDDALHPALLPQGLRDLLPPEAAWEAEVVSRLAAVLTRHGYERVKPPLAEFEDNLLAGAGAAMAKETFRLMDPISQRMIGLRADMTPQVARIATTRLKDAPRPLRLFYAGQVLRVRGGEIRVERQVGQVGAELIGSDAVAADIEVVAVAAEALTALGIAGLSVDLTLPTLVPALCRALGLDAAALAAVRGPLDHKDAAATAAVGGAASEVLGRLLTASGSARPALAALARLDLPQPAAVERTRLEAVVAGLERRMPQLSLTVDPVENRGFEYHTGISFAFFARGLGGELGRGGRYLTAEAGEPATGFTLYSDTLLQAAPAPTDGQRLYLPVDAPPEAGGRWRGDGWVTVAGLGPVADVRAEARRLGCSHFLAGDKIMTVA
ncbi:MAG TPA: ATP phosphoribosyltransferase regulatory subunit [Stellaceae bacterium]|nr:ATP phosphoribosyltransferase regulatory subunit [Stellaceae bacterium]